MMAGVRERRRYRRPLRAVPSPWGSLSPIERVVILGMPVTGKSTEAKRLTSDAGRVLFFDPCGDYLDVAEPLTVDELLRSPDVLRSPVFSIAIQPQGGTGQELAGELDAVIELARACRDLVLVLDEVGDYRRWAEGPLERLARNGRHDGIAQVYVSQCATDIPRTVRRLATRVVSFLQVDPDDLEVLRERYGEPFAACAASWRRGTPPAVWRLPSLERHQA